MFMTFFVHEAFFLGGELLFETIEFCKNGQMGLRGCPILDIKPWTIMMNLWTILSIFGVSTYTI